MGKRKARQRKPDTMSENESTEVLKKEEPSQTPVQTSREEFEKPTRDENPPESHVQTCSYHSTKNPSSQRFMSCGCPDENALEKQVTFGASKNALPSSQQSEASRDPPTICRLPPAFGLYHGMGRDLVIRRSRTDISLFFLSLKYATYDPTPSVTLSRQRGQVIGAKIIEKAPIATATVSKPPHKKEPDIDIRLYDPDSPSHNSSNPQEALVSSSTDTAKLIMNFDYQIPGCETKEQFSWRYDGGPEVRGLKGGRHGMKLVREQTGVVIGAWTKPKSAWSETKQGKMAFFDRSLGAQFEFLALMSLIAHRNTERVYSFGTYDPGSRKYDGHVGSTRCQDSRYTFFGAGDVRCPERDGGHAGFGGGLFGNSNYSSGIRGYRATTGFAGAAYTGSTSKYGLPQRGI